MRTLISMAMIGTAAAAMTACAPVAPVGVATTAVAMNTCAASSPIDVNGDGWISGTEWNTFRTAGYGAWDVNHDGRISRAEFESCYRAGGFYPTSYYNPGYWTNYWTAFDANGDGYLSSDEYWSSNTWTRIDRNGNGRIDADEWVWWGS